MGCDDNCDLRCDFAGNYEMSGLPVVKELEQKVLGCNYGGTSWTTADQTADILEALALGEGSHLLELGSGSGWPGLHLCSQSGCKVTLVDLPLIALQQAGERARDDRIEDRVEIVMGDATRLPFGSDLYERLHHSDVLCCLPEKREMLEECRRVAVDGARMYFSVIEPAPDLSPADESAVLETGPPFVGIDGNYPDMLEATGWHLEERVDVSEEYSRCLGDLAKGLARETPELLNAFGAQQLAELREHRENQEALVRDRKMLRYAYVTVATGSDPLP